MRFGFVQDVPIERLKLEAAGKTTLTLVLEILERGKVKAALNLMRQMRSLPPELEEFLGDAEAFGEVVPLDGHPVSGQGTVDLLGLK